MENLMSSNSMADAVKMMNQEEKIPAEMVDMIPSISNESYYSYSRIYPQNIPNNAPILLSSSNTEIQFLLDTGSTGSILDLKNTYWNFRARYLTEYSLARTGCEKNNFSQIAAGLGSIGNVIISPCIFVKGVYSWINSIKIQIAGTETLLKNISSLTPLFEYACVKNEIGLSQKLFNSEDHSTFEKSWCRMTDLIPHTAVYTGISSSTEKGKLEIDEDYQSPYFGSFLCRINLYDLFILPNSDNFSNQSHLPLYAMGPLSLTFMFENVKNTYCFHGSSSFNFAAANTIAGVLARPFQERYPPYRNNAEGTFVYEDIQYAQIDQCYLDTKFIIIPQSYILSQLIQLSQSRSPKIYSFMSYFQNSTSVLSGQSLNLPLTSISSYSYCKAIFCWFTRNANNVQIFSTDGANPPGAQDNSFSQPFWVPVDIGMSGGNRRKHYSDQCNIKFTIGGIRQIPSSYPIDTRSQSYKYFTEALASGFLGYEKNSLPLISDGNPYFQEYESQLFDGKNTPLGKVVYQAFGANPEENLYTRPNETANSFCGSYESKTCETGGFIFGCSFATDTESVLESSVNLKNTSLQLEVNSTFPLDGLKLNYVLLYERLALITVQDGKFVTKIVE